MAETAVSPQPAIGGRMKTVLVLSFFILLLLFGGGLFLAFSGVEVTPDALGWFVFSYIMGLTMIVLPCTLPLAFVIVPLSMGKGPRKGFAIALAFGIGVAVTLSLYGVVAAAVGKVAIGTLDAPLETVKNWVYLIAGLFALVFALGELGFLKVRMPTYSGAAPMFIQKQGDVLKALCLGLFMGNIGVGCPHPATPLILVNIASSGDVFYGWLLFLVHALGRITPLLLLAFLGILGVNALSWVVKRRTAIEHATGWAMVFVAGFILVLGLFTHDWWVNSGIHTLLEEVTQEERLLNVVSGKLNTTPAHAHGFEEGPGLFGLPLWLGNWALVALWIMPLWWYVRRRQMSALTLPPEERAKEERVLPWVKAFVLSTTALLAVLIIWALPQRFLLMVTGGDRPANQQVHEAAHEIPMEFSQSPEILGAGEPATLRFTFPQTALNEFSLEHERVLHLVVIREDLRTFTHIHPDSVAFSPATFEVVHTFPLSGNYLLAFNTIHNGTSSVAYRKLTVPGNDAVSVDDDMSREKRFGSYDVQLTVDPPKPKARAETHLSWVISGDGKPVVDLAPYLGAPMHIAIVPEDLRTLIHTHGDLPDTKGEAHGFVPQAFANGTGAHMDMGNMSSVLPAAFGPVIEGHVTFPQPGRYMVFAEFAHEDQVVTTRFLLEVGGE